MRWTYLAEGLRGTIRQNATAYAYTVMITVVFANMTTRRGTPETWELFLFVAGATVGFAAVEAAASRGFRDRLRPEPSEVVMIGSAMAVFSVSAGLGVAVLLSLVLGGWVAWLVIPFVATVTYLGISGIEMGLAHRRGERMRVEDPDAGDKPESEEAEEH